MYQRTLVKCQERKVDSCMSIESTPVLLTLVPAMLWNLVPQLELEVLLMGRTFALQ